jgi:hypothetical protein
LTPGWRERHPQDDPAGGVSGPFLEDLAATEPAGRKAFLRDLLLLVGTQLGYCARTRVLLRRMAFALQVRA